MHRFVSAFPILMSLLPVACGSEGATEPASMPPAGTRGATADGYAPAPLGAVRVKLALDSFELPPGTETYKCQSFANPFGRDVAILQSQASMSGGSHHLLVFSVEENSNAPLAECSGLEFHPTLHVAQTPSSQTTYPAGVGASHPGAKGIRLNAHYLNLTSEPIKPHVEVVLDVVDPSAVRELAAAIILNDATIMVPPGAGMAGGSLTIPPEVGSIKLLRIQSHMHRHGAKFQFSVDGGSPVYETTSWDEPPVEVFSPEMVLRAGATLTWHCNIENDTSAALTFGESASTNEMCTTTGYYYPAPRGMGLIGDLVLGKISLVQ